MFNKGGIIVYMIFLKWILSLILTLVLIISAFRIGGLFINIILFSILIVFIVDILFIRKKYL